MKSKYFVISLVLLLAVMALAACAPQTVEVTRVVTETETVVEEVEVTRVVDGEVVTEQIEVTRIVEVAAEPEVMEPVTLEFYHWFGADLGETTIKAINAIFQAENPHITVEFETADTATYEQVINTRLSANDAPDLFGVFPGTKFHPQAEAGFLMDLNDEPWVDTLFDGAKFVSTYQGRVMALPIDANVIREIFHLQ